MSESVRASLLVTCLFVQGACSSRPGSLFSTSGVVTLEGGSGGSVEAAGSAGAAGANPVSGGASSVAGASDAGAAGTAGGASAGGSSNAGSGGRAGGAGASPDSDAGSGGGGAPPSLGGGGSGGGLPAAGAGPGGSGGAPPIFPVEGACKGQVVPARALIADFEQGVAGWTGYIDDQFGPLASTAPGAAMTARAATFSGGAAADSGMEYALRCTDVSAFAGISFWAKGRGGDHVRFLAGTPATEPLEYGGDCDSSTMVCWDHPGKLFVLSDQWQQYQVAWSDLAQVGWGTPASFSGIVDSLLWINDGPVASFEFSIDQVTLYASPQ